MKNENILNCISELDKNLIKNVMLLSEFNKGKIEAIVDEMLEGKKESGKEIDKIQIRNSFKIIHSEAGK